MTTFNYDWIAGCMLGIEFFSEDDIGEGSGVIIDLFFVRLVFHHV